MVTKSPNPDEDRSIEQKHRDENTGKENAVEHVIRTGLPPGIEEEELSDPGSSARRSKPSQQRS